MDRLQNNPEAIELMIIKEPEAAVANFDDERSDDAKLPSLKEALHVKVLNLYAPDTIDVSSSLLVPSVIASFVNHFLLFNNKGSPTNVYPNKNQTKIGKG